MNLNGRFCRLSCYNILVTAAAVVAAATAAAISIKIIVPFR